MNKLIWVAVLFVSIVVWLVLDHPIYQKQVDALGLRIDDPIEQVEVLEQDIPRHRDHQIKY